MKMRRGVWNIPIPHERNPVRPTALPVPLVGFDTAGYRLGYGGGYYDRWPGSLCLCSLKYDLTFFLVARLKLHALVVLSIVVPIISGLSAFAIPVLSTTLFG
jgi:hypothetical protein